LTIKDLEQYRQLQKEVEQLNQQLGRLQNDPGNIVTVTVKSSNRRNPYNEQIIPITGFNEKHMERFNQVKTLLEERVGQALEAVVEIEKFIKTIPRSDIRRIIDYRYIQGLSWAAVSTQVYGSPIENRARMAIQRYFEKN